MRNGSKVLGALTAFSAFATGSLAFAQVPFYAGRTIQIHTGFSAGGTYDTCARLLAEHMGRHIAGVPNFVVKNMPGAASVRMMNYLYNTAKRDGTEFGIPSQGIPLAQALDEPGVKFDVRKMHWLGSAFDNVNIAFSWHSAPVKTIKDAFHTELVVGATGPGSATSFFPRLMNSLLGTKFKIVEGYSGSSGLQLAIERGEVQGRAAFVWSGQPDQLQWFKDNRVNILVQMGIKKAKELPHIPLMHELAKNPKARDVLRLVSMSTAVGYPFVTPPGLPHSRVAILQKAFDDTMRDPRFLTAARKANFPVEATKGVDLSKIVNEIVDSPQDIISAAKTAMPKRKRK